MRRHGLRPFAAAAPGCMIWQESFLMLKSAPDRDEAYRFLNGINRAVRLQGP